MMLSNALGNLRKRAASVARPQMQTKSQSKELPENKETNPYKTQPAPESGSKPGSFPKYLANAFAQESNRFSERKNENDESDNQINSERNDDHQLENVTNMIRAKLKEMKPLA
jgi:hypothetical protein